MNKNELKHILENNFLDILQKIFNYMSEELAQTNEQDIKALEKIDNELNEKVELLKHEFKSLDENKKNNISKGICDIMILDDIKLSEFNYECDKSHKCYCDKSHNINYY